MRVGAVLWNQRMAMLMSLLTVMLTGMLMSMLMRIEEAFYKFGVSHGKRF